MAISGFLESDRSPAHTAQYTVSRTQRAPQHLLDGCSGLTSTWLLHTPLQRLQMISGTGTAARGDSLMVILVSAHTGNIPQLLLLGLAERSYSSHTPLCSSQTAITALYSAS